MKTFEEVLSEANSINESQSIEKTLKDAKLKILLIFDVDGTIKEQHFVDNESEARAIVKNKAPEDTTSKYFDLAANKTQEWYKPSKTK